MSDAGSTAELLATAVEALGGTHRPGQLQMAEAVATAFDTGEHLAVQAGTGTGKSLAYLVPAIEHALTEEATVVVSTATIALQRQLVDRDLPRLAEALAGALPRTPRFALLKGRRNYLCLNKVHGGAEAQADESQEELFTPTSALGRDVARLTEWASETRTGDRDDLRPGVPERAWSQVSVSARECLGMARCPYGTDCFAEKARAEAGRSDIVVTNHALLAIDAIADASVLPEHSLLIIDEAHELVDRVTAVATGELSPGPLGLAVRRVGRLISPELTDRIEAAVATFSAAIHDTEPGRIDRLDDELATYLTALRDAAAGARAAIDPAPSDPKAAAARNEAIAALSEISDTAARMLASFGPPLAERADVVWLDHEEVPAGRSGATRGTRPVLRIAPLTVSNLLAERLFGAATTVLTSATLTVGGSFTAMAADWGLTGDTRWRGLDVGSPFDYPKSGILYVAAHLPPPGRDGTGSTEQLEEMAGLIGACGGRTLGLFSSIRAARAAAEEMRSRLDTPVLCQGEDATAALVEQFAADQHTSLFGTLSLWQGVDVPGPSCSLVLIDRIPFPRPDDPLLTARQRAVAARGGNGFMTVAASHAALLLAQGAGRLLRSTSDRGVVAILDSRMANARYGGFLRASLPPFWTTTDPTLVKAALTRLHAGAAG
ncbi:MAG: ATP-dependent helicase DinG [Actinomycetota bacterium]|nr:ATP-dependent helicase DinG [Actinomycetota bacterium]